MAVAVPIALMYLGMDKQWYLIPMLLGFFAVYKYVDNKLNQTSGTDENNENAGSIPIGLLMGITALIASPSREHSWANRPQPS